MTTGVKLVILKAGPAGVQLLGTLTILGSCMTDVVVVLVAATALLAAAAAAAAAVLAGCFRTDLVEFIRAVSALRSVSFRALNQSSYFCLYTPIDLLTSA